eukprot:4759498-Pyramimonas_sp.AAC.1
MNSLPKCRQVRVRVPRAPLGSARAAHHDAVPAHLRGVQEAPPGLARRSAVTEQQQNSNSTATAQYNHTVLPPCEAPQRTSLPLNMTPRSGESTPSAGELTPSR